MDSRQRGMRGKTGKPGARGRRGAQGVAGPAGARGPAGPAGPAGESAPLRILATITQQIEVIQRDLQIQFKRTAQLQADLDNLRAHLAKQSESSRYSGC
jgi:Collagen triple helix repeat (20 copies)